MELTECIEILLLLFLINTKDSEGREEGRVLRRKLNNVISFCVRLIQAFHPFPVIDDYILVWYSYAISVFLVSSPVKNVTRILMEIPCHFSSQIDGSLVKIHTQFHDYSMSFMQVLFVFPAET